MAKDVTIANRQNIIDIALQEYGSVEAVFDLLDDNPQLLSLNEVLEVGSVISIDESKIVNPEIVQFFKDNNIKPTTGDLIFKFNFSFIHEASEINMQFDGLGTLDVEFGDGFIQTYNTGENINYLYTLSGEKEVKIRFSNQNSISKIVLNNNQVKGFVDLTLFPVLQEVLLHNNSFTLDEMNTLLTTIDQSSITNLIISLYGNSTPNQALADLINDLALDNNFVEIAWLGLNIVES